MTDRVQVGSLQVAKVLHDFINERAIPGTGVEAAAFWAGVEALIKDLAPKNKALLAKRDDFQAQIDAWHQARAGQAHNAAEYKAFLQEIGYLLPEPADFQATTQNVDEEIATMAGPQLVVPVMNARFAVRRTVRYRRHLRRKRRHQGPGLQRNPWQQGHRLCPCLP